MLIGSSLSNSNPTGSKVKGELVKFISTLFEPRNAVNYKLHHFEEITFNKPTYCSQCKLYIWTPKGMTCKLCKLTCHPSCVDKVSTVCNKAKEKTLNVRVDVPHKFKEEWCIKPTYCDHCGNFVTNITKPGASRCNIEEGGCGLIVHKSCIDKVNQRCQVAPKISIEYFSLLRKLGEGATSKVYLAEHIIKQEKYAIKVIKKTNEIISADPEKALAEMEFLKIGRNFPFLTKLHCCFQSKTNLFFVMEYVQGQNLYDHIEHDRKFSEDRARFYGAEIVLALNHLHTLNVVYRDLKLENIIIDGEGHCKLLDFGLSKMLKPETGMKTKTFCGTDHYLSPEMIEKKTEYGFSVDWWAFGVLMYNLLTGVPPFIGDRAYELHESILKDEVELPRSLSSHASLLLRDLLNKDPEKRLGCRSLDHYEEGIFNHPFFIFKLDDFKIPSQRWTEIKDKKLKPPRITLKERHPVEGEEKPILTPVDPEQLEQIPTDYYGFSFYSESFEVALDDSFTHR